MSTVVNTKSERVTSRVIELVIERCSKDNAIEVLKMAMNAIDAEHYADIELKVTQYEDD